ncbi:Hsp70 family protein [Halobacteriovorax sp. HLS]|uniref:Hsp70 family protein n=1 Tax=Halobacteriovorax sp. HLS TaxID=2234000 RepID=UPI000FDAF226|nr:Hsp70 family protein [Halobacteriovorax sp. HLS]
MAHYAIDFGTSNSLLNYICDSGTITPVPLEKDGSFILRSLLFTPSKGKWFYGKEAIEQYVENDGEGRFFRSLKKFLPEANYSGTEVHNRKMKITELISVFLRELKHRADSFTQCEVDKVVLGRPAMYSRDKKSDQLAEDRMRQAAELAGFKEIIFCPEPLAAGLDFDKDNKEEKIVLIADFGGGTSDFTLMKLHSGTYSQDDILGLSGVFVAGDAIDGETMNKFISKHFGSDFEYQVPFGNNILKFPKLLLNKLCSPAHITHLREKETWEYLKEIQKFSIDEESKRKLDQLFTLVECQLGFPIFNEIEQAKISISTNPNDQYIFQYKYPGININQEISPTEYYQKIQVVIDKIIASLKDVFEQSKLSIEDVDQVCLTGGSAQFKLIQDELSQLFGQEKLIKYNIYNSVVGGLSEYAIKLD